MVFSANKSNYVDDQKIDQATYSAHEYASLAANSIQGLSNLIDDLSGLDSRIAGGSLSKAAQGTEPESDSPYPLVSYLRVNQADLNFQIERLSSLVASIRKNVG